MVLPASLTGVVAGYAGAFVSYDNARMPTGPWIVMVASAIFFFSLTFAPERGAVARYLRRRKNRQVTLVENVLKTMHRMGEVDGKEFAFKSQKRFRSFAVFRCARFCVVCADWSLKAMSKKGNGEEWKLTAEGRARGARITRLHRLWEVYLTSTYGLLPITSTTTQSLSSMFLPLSLKSSMNAS